MKFNSLDEPPNWKPILKDLDRLFGIPENLKSEWQGKEQHGYWLPFIDLEDLYESMKHLVKWRDFYCFRFRFEDHKYEKRDYEYFPMEQELVLKPKMTNHPGDMHTIGIKIKMGMRFL